MSQFTIRGAVSGDAKGIAVAQVQSWRETYKGIVPESYLMGLSVPEKEGFWRALLRKKTEGTWVAVDAAEEVLGFVSAGPHRENTPHAAGELYAIYLLKTHQGTGLGRKLFETAAHWLTNARLTPFILWVYEENPTRGFYEAMGGKLLPDRKRDECEGKQLVEVSYLFR